jgi:hypothetical protein
LNRRACWIYAGCLAAVAKIANKRVRELPRNLYSVRHAGLETCRQGGSKSAGRIEQGRGQGERKRMEKTKEERLSLVWEPRYRRLQYLEAMRNRSKRKE